MEHLSLAKAAPTRALISSGSHDWEPAAHARLPFVLALQRSVGNRAVQRLIRQEAIQAQAIHGAELVQAQTDAGTPPIAGAQAAAPEPDAGAQTTTAEPDAGGATPPAPQGAQPGKGDSPAPAPGGSSSSTQSPGTASAAAAPAAAASTTPPIGTAAGGPGACPPAPGPLQSAPNCPLPAGSKGASLPQQESAPTLPVIGPGDFGGDPVVTAFIPSLAHCRAGRLIGAEVEKRYQGDVQQARTAAKAQAKLDRDKAMTDAEAAVPPPADRRTSGVTGRRCKKHALRPRLRPNATHARTRHRRPPRSGARTQRSSRADLEAQYTASWATSFRATMEAVLREYGPGWQKQSLERLKKARSAKLKALKEKPKVKKGETPPPAKTKRKLTANWPLTWSSSDAWKGATANWLEGFKVGWMVARREEVDFDTLQQKGVKSLPSNFVAPRDVPKDDLLDIPSELQASAKMPGVAPEVVGFLRALQQLEPKFTAGNSGGHGSSGFAGKGFSLDLYLPDSTKKTGAASGTTRRQSTSCCTWLRLPSRRTPSGAYSTMITVSPRR